MMVAPNGLKYNIEFNDETQRVVLVLPHGKSVTRLEFDNVREVLEFIGQPMRVQKTA